MKSLHERRELRKYGGELISLAPTPSMKFRLSDEPIRVAHITARAETSDAGARLTRTRVATVGVFAMAAKKKRNDTVTLVVVGDDVSQTTECGGRQARAGAETFAHEVNDLTHQQRAAVAARSANAAKSNCVNRPC